MDHKSWLWRRRSSEKTIVAAEKVAKPLRKTEVETRTLPTENEVGPERSAKNLNEKLASVLLDHPAKDEVKRAQEADTGCEKVKAECLKQKLDEALRQGAAANEQLTRSEAALKECVQKLKSVQEEQDQRIHDAITKTSIDYEKAQKKLEEQLEETSKQLTNLAFENGQLSKALLAKEKIIEDLQKHKSQADAEFNVLMARVDSVEKENAYLKYEFHVLEKELEIRNEEMEYNRRSADAAHKQHLECVKKSAKLEAECQRLRLLMRKRLPGAAALANMKSEVDMLGRDHANIRRRNQNPTRDLVVRNATETSSEIPNKNMSFMIEKLRNMEEENKALKEIVTKKNTELHSSRFMYVRTASRLSQAEAQLIELSKGQKSMELTRCTPKSNEHSLLSGSDIGSDDGISSSGSWANALISELEHFRTAKLKSTPEHQAIEVSDMSLMDDFAEMEKLAIVSMNTPRKESHPNFSGTDLIPVSGHSDFSNKMQSKNVATEKTFDWLQIVLNAMLEQKRISKRSLNELFEDIKIALGYINRPTSSAADSAAISNLGESDPIQISGYITWKSPNASPLADSLTRALAIDTSVEEKGNQNNLSNLSESVGEIIKLIEGINPTPFVSNNTPDHGSKRDQDSKPFHSPTSSDYFVRVFQWKRSELSGVLRQFVCTCTDLLNGKADLGKFATELLFALEWIINNHVTPKGTSSARNKIKKHFGWMDSRTENEPGVHTSEEQSSCLPLVASSPEQDVLLQMEEVQCKLQEENSRLKDELKNMEASKKDMEALLQSATDKSEALTIQLQEAKQSIGNLEAELETLKESRGMIEDQIENQKSINEELDTQLSVAKAKLNEVFQKFSSLEVELDDKNNCCEELEATCLELQLQLESVAKETPQHSMNQEGKQSQNGWEMTTASIKLAECQETILHLGKQLKALASPREAVLFDKVFCNTSTAAPTTDNKNMNKRSSLRDRMLAEDGTKAEILKSSKIKETISTADTHKELLNSNSNNALCAPNGLVHTPEAYLSSKHKGVNNAVGALAVVPSKKQGGFGLLRKLLLRRKKGGSKKSPPSSLIFSSNFTFSLIFSRTDQESMDAFSSFYNTYGSTQSRWSYDSLKNFRQISPPVQAHLKKVYLTLCCTLVASAAGAYLHFLWNIGGMLTTIACFGSILWLFSTPAYQEKKKLSLLMAAATFEGASLGPLFDLANAVDPSILVTAFVGTALAFGCFSAAAMLARRREYLYLGGLLSSGLSVLLWLHFASAIFGGSTAIFKFELYFGLLLFIGFIVVDTQDIIEKAHLGDMDYVNHAMLLFTDFIAVFVRVLVIMLKNSIEKGEKKKKRRD